MEIGIAEEGEKGESGIGRGGIERGRRSIICRFIGEREIQSRGVCVCVGGERGTCGDMCGRGLKRGERRGCSQTCCTEGVAKAITRKDSKIWRGL